MGESDPVLAHAHTVARAVFEQNGGRDRAALATALDAALGVLRDAHRLLEPDRRPPPGNVETAVTRLAEIGGFPRYVANPKMVLASQADFATALSYATRAAAHGGDLQREIEAHAETLRPHVATLEA